MARIKRSDYRKNPPRRSEARIKQVKVRVVPKVRMPKSVLLQKIEQSARTGVIDPDIDVRVVEYGTQYEGRDARNKPPLEAKDVVKALQDFWKMMVYANTKEID